MRAAIRNMPLRFRLSFGFFCLAIVGTFSLVWLAINSHHALIREEERERLEGYHRAFDHSIALQGSWAVSLASSFALNPEISAALAKRDRLRLIELCYPAYIFMLNHYGISQFNFHVLPPRNFVRLQKLYVFGDDLGYRQTILDTVAQRTETYGIEEGITGYGIRGVAPIFRDRELVGTVEIGFSFGSVFLETLKKQFDIEVSILTPDKDGKSFRSLSSTFPSPMERTEAVYARVFQDGNPQLLIREISGGSYGVLVRTVKDYKGQTFALVEFCVKRAPTLAVINRYRHLMLGVGFLSMLLSVLAIYLISRHFTQPIARMVTFARDIASGEDVLRLELNPAGELGILADALNDMLHSLGESRKKIQDYTENLEQMVQIRTRALRESEEKYRTLVENVPLVVYRLLGDGKTIFINHFVEEFMGIPFQKAIGSQDFWKEKVCEEDRPRIWPLMHRCLKEGSEFKAEYRVRHANGNLLFVLDHAMPVFDEKGKVETVDGFLVNVTERHHLQEQIIQTEELRTLSEVSARLAHEIRNPLVAAGGFGRRVLESLPDNDPNREKVHIIVHEVARLEKILEKTLAYLKPFEILTESSSLNELLKDVLSELEKTFCDRRVEFDVSLSENLAPTLLDREQLKKALTSIICAMIVISSTGRKFEVKTYPGERAVHLQIVVKGIRVTDDEIEHFFYPFTTRSDRPDILDLPLAKMIIHKHQGLIQIVRKDRDQLWIDISLPL